MALEVVKPYWPFILALSVVIVAYLFYLIVGPGIKPSRIVLNETIPTLAYPKTGVLKEIEFGTLKIGDLKHTKIKISRGWLTREFNEFNIQVPNNSYAELEFEVLDSNWYSNLFIKVNGEVIWSGRPRRATIRLNQTGENKITIGTGINFRFWAPTYYELDLKVRISSYLTFEFPVAKGLTPTGGILTFQVTQVGDPTGPLEVKLNDKLIYSSALQKGHYTLDLPGLVAGNNTIDLSAISNSFNLSNVLVRVSYEAPKSSHLISFTITKRESEYLVSGISKASLSFEVIQIRRGEISLEINNKTVWTGDESDTFDVSDELKQGKNTLKLLVIRGIFYPKNLTLLLK